ncbi:MAG: nucleoside deaminase [Rubrobacteraceae bacterium]
MAEEMAFASVVLPTPGTSAGNPCPPANKATRQRSTTSFFILDGPRHGLTEPAVHLAHVDETLYLTALQTTSIRRSRNRSRTTCLSSGIAAIIGLVPRNLDPETPNGEEDLAMMRRALDAAKRAAERGEVPVGAVVARADEILSVAANEREATQDPTAHAELLALREAASRTGSWRLTGCTLYSTLEPCPMCAGAAYAARISRLVYAATDPKAGFAGTLHDLPADTRLNHNFQSERGLLEIEAAELLRAFFKNRRKKS